MSITRCGGGGGVPGGGGLGMSSRTPCVWMGSVTISMTSSTSITSMSGVVLTSHIGSSVPPEETFIDMVILSRSLFGGGFGFGEEGHLQQAALTDGVEHARHALEARIAVGLQVQFGLRHLAGLLDHQLEQ